MSGDRDDHVAAAPERRAQQLLTRRHRVEPGRGAGAVRRHGHHDSAVPDGVTQPRRHGRDQVLRLDADVGIGDAAGGDQLQHRPPRGVDRHREPDAVGGTRVAANLRVDADHPALRVEQRPTGVAVVDRRIRLDRVHEVVVRRRQRVDRPADRRDDADAQRADVAERAADRGDGLADLGRSRIAERDGRERVGGRIDLDQADVVEDVPADDRRGHSTTRRSAALIFFAPSPAFVITWEFVRM